MKDLQQKQNQLIKESQQWEKEKEYLIKKRKLKNDKKDFFAFRPRLISTSKLLTLFLFLNCTTIEIFTGWVTVMNIHNAKELMITPDLSPLNIIIGAVIGETIGFAIYSIKAAKENSKGGIVYQQAMLSASQGNTIEEQIQ